MITWRKGEPITAEKLNRVTADLYRRQRMRVSGAATYTEGPNGKTLNVIGQSGGGFSGLVYVKGTKVDLTSSTAKDWVRVQLNNGTAAYADGPPSDPFPADEEWYEVANTYGDIHCP